MKILTLHSNSIEVKSTKQAIKDADTEHEPLSAKEALVVFTSVEKKDEQNRKVILEKAVKEIESVLSQVKAKEIVLYPYVHLTSEPSSPIFARDALDELAQALKKNKHVVKKAPFGWYKEFTISVKGHPLAELSRVITAEDKVIKKAGKAGKATARSEKELEEYAEHDHRRIGKDLEMFFFHETAPGAPYWLPNGLLVLNELIAFWREEHNKRGYKEIAAPLINKSDLWHTSGHWEHYRDDMFIADMGDNEVYGLKPMNCPNAMIIFGSKTRSYKDLPLRLSDTDMLHRFELSGTLSGLLRARSFRQDDSHNFITEEQIENEYNEIFEIAERFYSIFGLKYKFRLGTRPDGFLGDVETWNRAEAALKKILDKWAGKGKYIIAEKDGAFYGPKIDLLMVDALGRAWQTGTFQLDFQLPKRFNLKYTDTDGKERTPVVVHRVVYGSLERFLAILLEHTKGALPTWLSPVQVAVLPLSDKHHKYSGHVYATLKKAGVRVEHYEGADTLEYRIRAAQMQKIPYMLVVGEKEEKAGAVAVRTRDGKVKYGVKLEEFAEKLTKEIKNRD